LQNSKHHNNGRPVELVKARTSRVLATATGRAWKGWERALVVHHSAESSNLAAVDRGVKLDTGLPPMDRNYINSYGRRFLSALVLVCTALVKELDVSRPKEAIHDHTRVTA
jgi:hypothetical protein